MQRRMKNCLRLFVNAYIPLLNAPITGRGARPFPTHPVGLGAGKEIEMARETHEAKIARWKAEAAPYCILRLSKTQGYVPIRRKGGVARFPSVHAALVESNRLQMLKSHRRHMLFIDFASAFPA